MRLPTARTPGVRWSARPGSFRRCVFIGSWRGWSWWALVIPGLCPALDKPTGAPLVMSDIETEQPIPLAYLSTRRQDRGLLAASGCTGAPSPSVFGGRYRHASCSILPPDSPARAPTFTAQLWSASLAGSLAWQKPVAGRALENLRQHPGDRRHRHRRGRSPWGMIATSARRPYPKDTLVIGNLHPDSSLGGGRATGRPARCRRQGRHHARDHPEDRRNSRPRRTARRWTSCTTRRTLNLTCMPVDNIVEATEVVMNDPLPDPPTGSGPPKYERGRGRPTWTASRSASRTEAQERPAPTRRRKINSTAISTARKPPVWKQVYAEVKEGQRRLQGRPDVRGVAAFGAGQQPHARA